MDEVLSVGDAEFQRRCLGRMEELANTGRTVVFVSHALPAVAQLCDRAIWIDGGQLVGDGPAAEVIANYLHQTHAAGSERTWTAGVRPGERPREDPRDQGARPRRNASGYRGRAPAGRNRDRVRRATPGKAALPEDQGARRGRRDRLQRDGHGRALASAVRARRIRRHRVDPGEPAERGLGDRRGRDLQHRLPEARAPRGRLRGRVVRGARSGRRRLGTRAVQRAVARRRTAASRVDVRARRESRSNQPSPARDCRQHVRMARGSRCRLAVVRRAVRPAIHARRGRRRLGPRHEGARGRLANVLRRATRPRVATGRGVSPRPGPEPGRARGRRRLPRVHARGVDPAAPLRPRAPLVRRAGMVRRGPPRGRLSRPHTAHPRGAAPGASLGHARVAPFEAPGRLAPRSDASRSPPRRGSGRARIRPPRPNVRLPPRGRPHGLRARQRVRHALRGMGRGGRRHRGSASSDRPALRARRAATAR